MYISLIRLIDDIIKYNFSKQQKDIQSQKSHYSDPNTCMKLFYY